MQPLRAVPVCRPARAANAGACREEDRGQSGGAAARHIRPGLRSLRSPAASGPTNGPFASCRGPSLPPQAGARAAPCRNTAPCSSRAPAPRRPGPRGSAALTLTRTVLCLPPDDFIRTVHRDHPLAGARCRLAALRRDRTRHATIAPCMADRHPERSERSRAGRKRRNPKAASLAETIRCVRRDRRARRSRKCTPTCSASALPLPICAICGIFVTPSLEQRLRRFSQMRRLRERG
jgi:hypothetical protein